MDEKFDVIHKVFVNVSFKIRDFPDGILYYIDNREKILEVFPDYIDYMLFDYARTSFQRSVFISMIEHIIQIIFDKETPETFNKLMSRVRKKIPMRCPEKGEFIGYKKIIVEYLGSGKIKYGIAKLRIPETAQRSSAFGSKCRCSVAFVEEIASIDGSIKYDSAVSVRGINKIFCWYNPAAIDDTVSVNYIVGKTVKPDSFDPNWWNECSNGIHFFMTREEAENYIP